MSSPFLAPPRPGAALPDLFGRETGWRAATGEPWEEEVAGRRFLLLVLATRDPAVALLCEPLAGSAMPAHPVRRRVCSALRQRFPQPLTIFTDAAHRAQVWAWRSREPGAPAAYRELTLPPELPARDRVAWLAGVLRDLEGAGRTSPPEPDVGPVRGPVLNTLLRRVRLPGLAPPGDGPPPGGASDGLDLAQRLQDRIEGSEDPELVRSLWRGLTRLTVLDPACGSGDWLLFALQALEPVYDACLERMGRWVDDADRVRARRGRFADFRALLERAGDPRQHPTRRHFVRESIVVRNLFGADPDPAVLACAEMRFLLRVRAAAEFPAEPHPGSALMCNLRAGELAAGLRTLRELRLALAERAPPDRLRRLLEEAETLDRAEHRFRSLRLEHGAAPNELLAGRRELLRRREALRGEIRHLLAGRPPSDPAGAASQNQAGPAPLHRCVEYFGVLQRGGFSLERDTGP